MKYEKYLMQIASHATNHLFWAWEFTRQAQENNPDDNIFQQFQQIEHGIWKANYAAENHQWLQKALAVPRKFVEQSRRTSALAVLNEWIKQEGE